MKMTHQDLLQGSHEGFFAGETIFPVNPFEDKTQKHNLNPTQISKTKKDVALGI